MPVSLLPIVTPLIALIAIVWSAFKGKKALVVTSGCVCGFFFLFLSSHFVPGWLLRAKANNGDVAAQYRYARWLENHSEKINEFLLWPSSPQVLEGYAWIDRAAEAGHLPSIYMKGIRLKYGEHVPRPQEWNGPSGNHFTQPELGQRYIDEALGKGFKPLTDVEEEYYYWHVYRGMYYKDPNG